MVTTRQLLVASSLLLAACHDPEPTATADTAPATNAEVNAAPAQLADSDPYSYADPARLATRHLDLDLHLDFAARSLSGSATLTLQRLDPAADTLVLDSRDLSVQRVEIASSAEDAWQATTFSLGERDAILGSPLSIRFPAPADRVRVHYRTAPTASGLQWLDAAQTADHRQPFLYSQSQAIHARSWVPLQDTPQLRITYTATVHTPPGVRALMSADNDPKADADGEYRFNMPQPIPSYLLAIAAGELAFRELGPDTGIYAEPSVIDAAAAEFSDTQKMLERAEAIYGDYRWGRYDLLILPPSFPYGGMENPRLTFATPTVIAGDKSLVALVAHELAHSWSGNLVTNAGWRDFWLNEGFTTYFTNRIMEAVYGADRAAMERVLELQDLQQALDEQPPEKTTLVPIQADGDPDNAVGPIVYNKGALFLRNLEATYGREAFDAFLTRWFNAHAFTSRSTEDFIAFLDRELLARNPGGMDMDTVRAWIYQPGLPAGAVLPTTEVFAAIDTERTAWLAGERSADALATRGWTVQHWEHFLDGLPDDITPAQLAALDGAQHLSDTDNAVLARNWFLVTIPAGYEPALPAIERHLKRVGRNFLVVPVYRALSRSESGLAFAGRVYAQASPGYHPITRSAVESVLAAGAKPQ